MLSPQRRVGRLRGTRRREPARLSEESLPGAVGEDKRRKETVAPEGRPRGPDSKERKLISLTNEVTNEE